MKMDELDAKREARRRRILDGAENRMKKILNLSTKADYNLTNVSNKTQVTSNYVQLERNLESVVNENDNPKLYNTSSNCTNTEYFKSSDLIDNGNLNCNETKTSVKQKNFNRIYIIITLAILKRFLILVNEKITNSNTVIYNIFVPLILFDIIDFIFLKEKGSDPPGMLNVILTLNNIPVQKANKILFIFGLITKLLQDVCLYFYTFVIIDYFFKCINF